MSINGHDLKVPLIGRGEDEEVGGGRSTAVPAASSKHSLGFGALVFLIYYNIGVPFGDEEVRREWGGREGYLVFSEKQRLLYRYGVPHTRYFHTAVVVCPSRLAFKTWGLREGWYLTSNLLVNTYIQAPRERAPPV